MWRTCKGRAALGAAEGELQEGDESASTVLIEDLYISVYRRRRLRVCVEELWKPT